MVGDGWGESDVSVGSVRPVVNGVVTVRRVVDACVVAIVVAIVVVDVGLVVLVVVGLVVVLVDVIGANVVDALKYVLFKLK